MTQCGSVSTCSFRLTFPDFEKRLNFDFAKLTQYINEVGRFFFASDPTQDGVWCLLPTFDFNLLKICGWIAIDQASSFPLYLLMHAL